MKITLNRPKQRNPLVALARFRHAGRHQLQGVESMRRQGIAALRRELDHMKQSP